MNFKNTLYIERNKELEIQAVTFNSHRPPHDTVDPTHAKKFSTQFTFNLLGEGRARRCIPNQIRMGNDGTARSYQDLNGVYLDVPLCKEIYDFFKENHSESKESKSCQECDKKINGPLALILQSYNGKAFQWSKASDNDGWWSDLGTVMDFFSKKEGYSPYTVAKRMADRCQSSGITPILRNAKLWEGYKFLGRWQNDQSPAPKPASGILPTAEDLRQ